MRRRRRPLRKPVCATVRAVQWTTVAFPDGRKLDVLVGRGPTSPGLLFHHGTPGNATRYETWFAAAENYDQILDELVGARRAA